MTRKEFINYMRHNTTWVNWNGTCNAILGPGARGLGPPYFVLEQVYDDSDLLKVMPLEAFDMAIRITPGAKHLDHPQLVDGMPDRDERYAVWPREKALAIPENMLR